VRRSGGKRCSGTGGGTITSTSAAPHLEEVRAELVARKLAAELAGRDERAADDHLVQPGEAGGAEVVVIRVDLEAGEGGKVVLTPF